MPGAEARQKAGYVVQQVRIQIIGGARLTAI